MIVLMKDFGCSLVTRASGRRAYEFIAGEIAQANDVSIFDFSGVENITNSFADEVFGRMAYEMGMEELRRRISFRDVKPFHARIIRSVMDSRDAQRPQLAVC